MIGKFKNLVTSLSYIFFEGLSKGGNTLIFLVSASILSSSEYVNFLALYSLEGLFIIFSPLYYTDVLYKIRDSYSSRIVDNNISFISTLYFSILLIIVVLFQNFLTSFYNSSLWIFLFIVLNTVFRILFQNKSVNHQVDEDHSNAIKDKAFPFFVSFILGLALFYYMEDKILGFFAGRAMGYSLVFIYYEMFNNNNISFKPKINIDFLKNYGSRVAFLVLNGFAAWFLGYGVLNILKLWYPDSINQQVGIILNLWSVFLMLSNGINSVYIPAFRKKYLESIESALMLYKKIKNVYISILFSLILFYFFTKITAIRDLLFTFGLFRYTDMIPYVIGIFAAQILQYICLPYYLVNDKFKEMAIIGIVGSLISILLIISHHLLLEYIAFTIYFIIVLGYYLRTVPLFLYKNKFLSH